jgi:NADH dehydrogenase FAD-containing subunit
MLVCHQAGHQHTPKHLKELPVFPFAPLQVDKHLRIPNHASLFALGDVTDVPEEKLAFLAAKQAHVVAASLAALAAASGGSTAVQAAAARRLGVWRPSAGLRVMLVTLGRK